MVMYVPHQLTRTVLVLFNIYCYDPHVRDRVVGAALFVGLGLGFWQQASGSEAAVYYSPHVLEVGEERRRRRRRMVVRDVVRPT